jgi:branched-chain amino acid transport system substrate-binding protein
MHNTGMDYPLYDDLKKYLYDAGKASGEHAGTVLYSRGLYAGMLAAEGIKTAQKMTGKSNITAGDLRDGFEALEMTEAKMASIGMPNFGPSFNVSCESHGGPMVTAIQQWDAKNKTWSLITPFKPGDMDVINRLIAEDSAAYAAENNLSERCG